jgi:hypothetical protein
MLVLGRPVKMLQERKPLYLSECFRSSWTDRIHFPSISLTQQIFGRDVLLWVPDKGNKRQVKGFKLAVDPLTDYSLLKLSDVVQWELLLSGVVAKRVVQLNSIAWGI